VCLTWVSVEQRTMKLPKPNRSKLERAMKRRDKQRRNWCRRCPFSTPGGRCLDTTIRSGRCGDWVFYLLPGGKQCRRRWVRPKDPLTPAQVRNRARLAAASRKYSAGLTGREHDACIASGARRRSRPRLGQSGPLTGQQYSVRRDYATNAGAKVQNTGIPVKVPKPQRVTRPTWEPRLGSTRVPPDQRQRGWRVIGRGQKPVATPQMRQPHRVTRFRWERDRVRSMVLASARCQKGPSQPVRRNSKKCGSRVAPAHHDRSGTKASATLRVRDGW
jgi:hypothetical protein